MEYTTVPFSTNRLQAWSVRSWQSKSYWAFFTWVSLVADMLFVVMYVVEMTLMKRSIAQLVVLLLSTGLLSTTIVYRLTKTGFRIYLASDLVFLLDISTVLMIVICLSVNPLLYIPYFWHVLVVPWRVKRLFRLYRATHTMLMSPFKQNIVIIIVTVSSFLFFFMCLFQIAELRFGEHISYSFYNVMYFVFVVVSTIGFGDIVPYSIPGKFTVILMVIVLIILVPTLVSNLMQSWRMEQSGGGSYNARFTRNFVVILGTFDSLSRTFDTLSAFFHTDDPDQPTELVLLSPVTLPNNVRSLLHDSIYTHRITFLVGDGTEETDMRRAVIDQASAVFITTSVHSNKLEEEDERNTLRARMIHNWKDTVELYMYNNYDQTKYYQTGLTKASVCLSKLKARLIGKNAVYCGASTLILNLLFQSIPKHLQVDHKELRNCPSHSQQLQLHYRNSLFTRVCTIEVIVREKMTWMELVQVMRHEDITILGSMEEGAFCPLSKTRMTCCVPTQLHCVALTSRTHSVFTVHQKWSPQWDNVTLVTREQQERQLRHVVLCVESRYLDVCINVILSESDHVRVTVLIDKTAKEFKWMDARVTVLRVNIKDVVVWKSLSEEHVDSVFVFFEKPTYDAKAILVYHMVKEIFQDKRTVVCLDITKKDHIRFLQRSGTDLHRDGLLTQPLYASGQVTVTNVMDTILYQTFFEKSLLSTVNHLLSSQGIQQIDCDADQLTFEQVFTLNLQRDFITVGIYRKTSDGTTVTITNPSASMLLKLTDTYFVVPLVIT